VNVGPLVVADTKASKLIEPRKCPLDDPAPSSQTAAVLGTAQRQQRQGCREFATRIGWPLYRSRGFTAAAVSPQNLGDAAAVSAPWSGGIASTSASASCESFRLAPVRRTASGAPRPPQIR
jgi:hypothetical protein